MDLEFLALRYAIEARDLEAWEAAHSEFHLELIRACGMPLLLQFCTMLHNLNDRYRRIFLSTNPGDRNVKSEHQAIADAAVGRRTDEACDLLPRHIERTGANLKLKLSPVLADQPIGHAD
jgi:GntR family carbon starvation induced transcriptional regulator